ncbi:TPA: relaxase/mobilization nuclease domain-containing protein [Streptococcus suis]|nr:relaxase/mobilization nuclease domain-containing protein [Streptococcus suis]HEM5173757.1 relaxase/mobilization nuclease domain-containing protein [Streptococcus suis]
MVVTKHLKPVKTELGLKRGIRYIIDDEKTAADRYIENEHNFPVQLIEDGELVSRLISGHLVDDLPSAGSEFLQMKQIANLRAGRAMDYHLKNEKTTLAHHIIQSFSPDDNLTPEEIHEIGRRTILELTGGEHAFVIATHMDKDHIHNHIYFNSTNEVTLKQFRWQKGTKKSLERISDKHADLYGAKVLTEKPPFDRKAYGAYQAKNTFRSEIKSRLEFLLQHSSGLDDFLTKAKLLNLSVDFSGKHVTYKLLDLDQQKSTRANKLSKKGRYNKDNIIDRLAKNGPVMDASEVQIAYQQLQEEKADDYEIQLRIEPWQVEHETRTGIYLKVDFGIQNQGTVKIPYHQIEKQDDGSFQIFIKRSDFYYFLNPDNSASNKFMKGTTLLKQLSYESGEYVLNKNSLISKLDQLFRDFEYLASHEVTTHKQFQELGKELISQLEGTKQTLSILDEQIAKLNKIASALQDVQADRPVNVVAAREILARYHIPETTPVEDIMKEFVEVSVERKALEEKFDSVLADLEKYQELEAEAEQRENDEEIDK